MNQQPFRFCPKKSNKSPVVKQMRSPAKFLFWDKEEEKVLLFVAETYISHAFVLEHLRAHFGFDATSKRKFFEEVR